MKTFLVWRLGVAGLLLGLQAGAMAADVVAAQEYDKYVDKHRTIQALDSSLFGEQINLRDGSVSFRVTDVALPGNGPTIRLVRSFRIRENNRFVETSGTEGAGWIFEIPRLKTITNYTTGTQASSVYGWQVPVANKDARCTSFRAPGPIVFPDPSRYWDDLEWWSGYQLVDDSGNETELLQAGGGYPELAGFRAVTTTNWRFSCLPTTANGEPGEGFLATAPDGTRYWFDYLLYTTADSMSKAIGQVPPMFKTTADASDFSTLGPAQDYLLRRHAALLVTRIEDRFGNWLTYQYSAGGGLTRIDASDGRLLKITGDTSLLTVSVGSGASLRDWTYASNAGVDTVTLPDGSAWTYHFSALAAAPMPDTATYATGQCFINTTNTGSTVQGTATSPSGVTGTFTFTYRRFGRSYVLRECWDPDGDGDGYVLRPANWFVYALDKRAFSGPGMAAQDWTYAYSPANASWSQDCASGCVDEVWTDVTAPDDVRQRSVFSNRFDETENLLLREQIYDDAGVLVRTVSHDYATFPAYTSSTPYAWPQSIGSDLQIRTNKARSERWTPARQRRIEQDGRAFTWAVPSTCGGNGTSPCYDKFARPIKVVKSSAPAP